jgi:hypothetical protein
MTTPHETELQVWQRALRDLVFDARDSLEPAVFTAWAQFLCCLAAHEAARCENWNERRRRWAA